MTIRFARVARSNQGTSASTIKAYLPGNYTLVSERPDSFLIGGRDSHGWTLEDYVIPRLASGLYFAEEVGTEEPPTPDASGDDWIAFLRYVADTNNADTVVDVVEKPWNYGDWYREFLGREMVA